MAQADPMTELRKRVQNVPDKPGVYRWLNEKGDVLYIGKAKSLKNRMKNYVQKDPDKSLGPWKLSLIKHLRDFDITVTSTELEALILETNLIKEMKPKYNVLMKDDKNYVYVRISADEYSQISIERNMQSDKAKYFGPFLQAYNIKRTLDMLHEIFRFRACDASIEKLNRGKEPEHACLQYQIGQCNGLCVGEVTKKQYSDAIEEVIRFLRGNRQAALQTLRDMMDSAAAEKKFERAAKLRDTLVYIQSLEEQQVVSDTSRENTDAIGIAMRNGKAQVVLLRERGGKLIEERTFALQGEANDIAGVIEQLIPQYYSIATDIPDLILIQEDIESRTVLEEWLTQTRNKKVEVRAPERGKKSKLLQLAMSNAEQKIAQQFAKWEAAAQNIADALEQLKDTLKLPTLPKRIEGYDISHLGGTETVGSMVVMKHGKPASKEYRSFTLRTVKRGQIDDYKAMQEVLRRRLRYLSNEKEQWKKRGITLGKAKKAEQDALETIIKKNEEKLGQNSISYKDFLVARHEEAIVGFGRMTTHKDGTLELQSIWVSGDMRGQKLGSFIARTLLEKVKKGKVYILINSSLEEYYANLRFRHVHTPPKVLADELKSDTHPDSCEMVMVYNSADNKKDTSLTSVPDLLLIDGGKGQLNAVVEVLLELGLKIPVAGLAKREEEVYLPGETLPEDLPKSSPANLLLQRLRDEAHRFSNAHREKRLAKGLVASALDEVSGIGPKTKTELLKKFGSVDGITKATDEQLLTVVNQAQLAALRSGLAG